MRTITLKVVTTTWSQGYKWSPERDALTPCYFGSDPQELGFEWRIVPIASDVKMLH